MIIFGLICLVVSCSSPRWSQRKYTKINSGEYVWFLGISEDHPQAYFHGVDAEGEAFKNIIEYVTPDQVLSTKTVIVDTKDERDASTYTYTKNMRNLPVPIYMKRSYSCMQGGRRVYFVDLAVLKSDMEISMNSSRIIGMEEKEKAHRLLKWNTWWGDDISITEAFLPKRYSSNNDKIK